MLGTARTWGVVYFCAVLIGCSASTFSSSGSGGKDAGGGSGGSAGGSGATAGGAGAPATGGSAGTTAGGSAGTPAAGGTGGGAVGGSGGAPATASPGCAAPSDCYLVSDCCDCTALIKGENPPPCNTGCVAQCPAATQLKCAFGQCTTDLVCDTTQIDGTLCLTSHPICPAGQVNSVNPTTKCWGPCVDPSDCLTLASCNLCHQGQVCVEYYDQNNLARRRCVDIPPACQGHADCSCMAPGMCSGSTTTCSSLSNGVGLRCDFSG